MSQSAIKTLKASDWFHADGFPVVVEPRYPQTSFGLHDHEFCEIVVITGGHGMHLTGRESWPMVAGDVFVITGNRPHAYDSMEELSLINTLYQPEKLQVDMQDILTLPGYHALFTLEPAWRESHEFKSRLHLSHTELEGVVGLIERLEQELLRREAGFRFVATALFMEIVVFLSRCYSASTHSNSQGLLRIAEAITYLESHYQNPIDLEQLAKIAHMSKRSLMRAFKKAMGVSPISYLIRVRLAKSVHFLQQEGLSIADVAHLVGYDDSNYFTRQFHATLGLSPSAYRRQLRTGIQTGLPTGLSTGLPNRGQLLPFQGVPSGKM